MERAGDHGKYIQNVETEAGRGEDKIYPVAHRSEARADMR